MAELVHPPGSRRRRRVLGAMSVCAALATAVLVASPPVNAELATEQRDSTPRLLGPVTVIGDSVLQGSFLFGPTVVDQLAAQGWGPIRGRAGVGYTTGAFSAPTEAKATYWIRLWRQQGWDAPNVLINLGANDSGRCDRSVSCARAAIESLVDEIGPSKNIWWPEITRHQSMQHQADAWNAALRQVATERTNVYTWDWPTVMADNGLATADNTHLSVSGYRLRSEMLADEFTATLATTTRVGGDEPLPAGSGARAGVVPLDPTRVMDTRKEPPGRLEAGGTLVVDISEYVPEPTTAVAAYIAATRTEGAGYLTAYDCSADIPFASAVNHGAGETRGAVAITPISAEGTLCVYTHAAADIIVDLQTAFVPSTGIEVLGFDPLPDPLRLVDTRQSGRADIITVPVPNGAAAASVVLSAIFPDRGGFLTAYPCDTDPPLAATVNYTAGDLISGTAFVPASADGLVCVLVSSPTDVTVDVTGTFSTDGALEFEPVAATRMIDTRKGTGGWSPLHAAGATIDVRVAPPDAVAATGTITMVRPVRTGFTRAWGCGSEPATASITSLAGGVLANSLTTAVSADGRLCVYTPVPGNTTFDVNGWWFPR